MKVQRLAIALTAINLALLIFIATAERSTARRPDDRQADWHPRPAYHQRHAAGHRRPTAGDHALPPDEALYPTAVTR